MELETLRLSLAQLAQSNEFVPNGQVCENRERELYMVPTTEIMGSIIALLLVSFPASESAAASECHAKSRVFLSHPSKPSLTALSALGEDACWTAFRSSNTNLDKLNKWVEQGNRWAAQYCI